MIKGIDDLDEVTARYGDKDFGALTSTQQNEYLSALAKRAGIDGATSVLNKLGLNDDDAASDLQDVRDLLRGFRIVRGRAFSTLLGACGKVLGWAIFLALAALFLKSEGGKALLHVVE